MRGKAKQRGVSFRFCGITPACAGKRYHRERHDAERRDHPRVCGEKFYVDEVLPGDTGSPPRVRGKVMIFPEMPCSRRITPACAGKSEAKEFACKDGRDHPRVCGEKTLLDIRRFLHRGSPPRVRGKVNKFLTFLLTIGITPACAGKRLKRSHSIGHFSYILCLFHSVLHRASASGGSRAGPCAPPCLPAQNAVPV